MLVFPMLCHMDATIQRCSGFIELFLPWFTLWCFNQFNPIGDKKTAGVCQKMEETFWMKQGAAYATIDESNWAMTRFRPKSDIN